MATTMATLLPAQFPQPVPLSPDSSEETLDFDEKRKDLDEQLHGEHFLDLAEGSKPMKILFLSSDTGGGHRASAESLANQFMIHFPGSSYDLLDIWKDDGIWPYNQAIETYKFMSSNPNHWRLFYHVTNSKVVKPVMTWHATLSCENRIRKRIESYDPDLIVSVHPMMNHAPIRACQKLALAHNKQIPFYTVITDLASAHGSWFEKGVDKLYLASESLYSIARNRVGVPEEKIVKTGLPIRHDFALQARKLGSRNSEEGKAYQRHVKRSFDLSDAKPMLLVMGGGEGVGGLDSIVNELYTALTLEGIDATLCVVCGRNQTLRESLQHRDWEAVLWGEYRQESSDIFCNPSLEQSLHPKLLMQYISAGDEEKTDQDLPSGSTRRGNVTVEGLGFVHKMAEYMVAADILVTKAGPGTISEAASVGLPVLLTSFLPGQEAGNVDFVLDNGFGEYCADPIMIGTTCAEWLKDEAKIKTMSERAQATGHANAAEEIVLDIGKSVQIQLQENEAQRRSLGFLDATLLNVDGISEFIVD